MLALKDNLTQSVDSLRAHKLRAVLTVLGLTMGVATLITVMTLVQGANLYVEQKIANLGTNVFQIARTPFTVTDFDVIMKALRHKYIYIEDVRAVAAGCYACRHVGATASSTTGLRFGDQELQDVNLIGQTANMSEIDTRVVEHGRFFTELEDQRAVSVCLIGQGVTLNFFPSLDPIGRLIRIGNHEFTVVGVYEKLGSVLGQDQDNFVVIPLSSYLRLRGNHNSLTVNVKAAGEGSLFETAQDQARMVLRSRRQIRGNQPEDFFIGTKESYISLWESISSAFFAVFIMVSSISAVVGGIVIMNVMLVSVTERTKEIGVRRAMGATRQDVLRQFLTESVIQCIIGGIVGVCAGFLCALFLRQYTEFPASVQPWVAILGVVMSSAIGLFFGIYPAVRASNLDPVVALRAD